MSVECYSGYTYAQEPRAFTWQGCRYAVAEIGACWRTPEGPTFRIRTETGQYFDLHYHELQKRWTIAHLPTYQSTNLPIYQSTNLPTRRNHAKLCRSKSPNRPAFGHSPLFRYRRHHG